MHKDMNHWSGIGRLGKDPEVKYVGKDKKVININIAVNGRSDVAWIPVTFWDSNADLVATRCQKGSKIAVEGRIQTKAWETKEGEKRYSFNVVADDVHLLSGCLKHDSEEPLPEEQPEPAV